MKRRNRFREFSKRAIVAMIALWFVGAAFGALVVVTELNAMFRSFESYGNMVSIHLPELLLYISAPMTGGIVGYMIKTSAENCEKIRRDRAQEDRSI